MSKIPLFHNLIASGFGSGYSPIAPGTAGALLATLIWWGYASLFNDYYQTLQCTFLLVCIFTFLGIWIALLAVPADNYIGYMFAAFILFRFFDILKPLGIKQAEKLPSGYGIMADDILSGIYGGIVILLYRFVCA